MARLPELRQARPGLLARIVYFWARRKLGRVPEPVKVLHRNPGLLAGLGTFEMCLERADRVPARLKALAELRVALEVGCRFCIDIGSAIGRQKGLTEADLRNIADHEEATVFSDLDRIVIDYAVAMSATPMVVPDELFDRMRLHLQDEQIVELTAAIAWENYRARFNHALGFKEEGFSEGAFCPLRPMAIGPVGAAKSG